MTKTAKAKAKAKAKARARAAADSTAEADAETEAVPPELPVLASLGLELCKVLEEAMQQHVNQVKQLQTLAATLTGPNQQLADDERRRLKSSMVVLVKLIQDLRAAGPAVISTLLLAISPEILDFFTTLDVLRLAACSKLNRAALSNSAWRSSHRARGRLGGCVAAAMAIKSISRVSKMVIPHLDAAPSAAAAVKRFFDSIDLHRIQSVSLPRVALDILLGPGDLPELEVESLEIPAGFEQFAALHKLEPRYLSVEVSHPDSPMSLRNCEGLARTLRLFAQEPLKELRLKSIPEAFDRLLLHVAALADRGAAERLVLIDCDLSDEAIAKLCTALKSEGPAGSHMSSVHFLDCSMSELAEQRVVEALEARKGIWSATIEGGRTKASVDADLEKWLEFGPHRKTHHPGNDGIIDEVDAELARLKAEGHGGCEGPDACSMAAGATATAAAAAAATATIAATESSSAAFNTASVDAEEPAPRQPGIPDLMTLALLRMQETFSVTHPCLDEDFGGNDPPAETNEARGAAATAAAGRQEQDNEQGGDEEEEVEEVETLELQQPAGENCSRGASIQAWPKSEAEAEAEAEGQACCSRRGAATGQDGETKGAGGGAGNSQASQENARQEEGGASVPTPLGGSA